MGSVTEEARRLGKIYALLTAAFVVFVTVVAMLAQFGLPEPVTAVLVILLTVVTYAIMGLVSRTLSLTGFYLSDRIVPAGFNGLSMAAAMLVLPFLGLAGAFLADRSLGLAASAGLVAGFVLLAVVVAPYYRKSGGVTLPDYLAVRFGNALVRLVAAAILCVALFPVLAAAMAIAAEVVVLSMPLSPRTALYTVLAVLLLTTLLGGLRSTTLAGGAQAIVALIAILVPTALLSLQEYGAPLPQVTFGYAVEAAAAEATAIGVRGGHALSLAGIDGFNMLAFALCLAAGIASLPQLVAQSGAAPGVGEARRTAGWALVVVGLLVATAPAMAAFVRFAVLRDAVGVELAELPRWIFDYGGAGMLEICGVPPASPAAIGSACGATTVVNGLAPADIVLRADLVALGFADITGLPHVLTVLIAAGAVAAALATAAAALVTIASALGNDIVAAVLARRASGGRRLIVTRLMLVAVAGLAAWTIRSGADGMFALAAAAPSIAASAFFPVLVLAVFWKRTTFWGALAGMLAGGGATIVYALAVVSGAAGPLPIPGLTSAGLVPAAAGFLGMPLGLLATVAASLLTASPGLGRREVVDAIRRPSPDPILEDHAT